MLRRFAKCSNLTMNEGPRVVHAEKIAMASVNQVISAANIAKGFVKACGAIGRYVAIQEVGGVIKKRLLSIHVDVEIFTLPDGIKVEHGEAVLVYGMVGCSTGASQMRVWIEQVRRRGTFSAVG